MRFPDARILIFAKAPQPGRVKTRLIPRLGAEGACRFYAWLLERRVRGLADAGLARIECWCAPDAGHPLFRALEREPGVALRVQRGGDLGARMQAAAAQALQQAEFVLLIGVDCPALTATHLAQALEWMRDGADAVLGPAEDGGYVLLGLRRAAPALFAEMPWGSERVLALTRARLVRLGWGWRELDTLWDLDRPADYERLLARGWAPD